MSQRSKQTRPSRNSWKEMQRRNARGRLTSEQIEAGSKFMAASNLGCEGMSGKKMETMEDVRNLWRQVLMAFEAEGISGAEEERRHWANLLIEKDKWTVSEVKKELPFLF